MVVTKKSKEFLENLRNIKTMTPKERERANKTFARIHKRIEEFLEGCLWLSINHPDILLDEARELQDSSIEPHRRIKMFFKIMNNLEPRFEVELVLKRKTIE